MDNWQESGLAPSIDTVSLQQEQASVIVRGDLALITFADDHPALVIPTEVAECLYQSLGEQLGHSIGRL